MSDTRIVELNKVSLRDPVLIQGLPGLGFVGKVTVDYLIEKLSAQKFAELYSSYLTFPDGSIGININSDGTFALPHYEFYAYNSGKENGRDFIFLTGDCQPITSGQIEVAEKVLEYVGTLGCRTVIGVGGYGVQSPEEVGSVYTVVGTVEVGNTLSKHGAKIANSGAVTGACGVILGLATRREWTCMGLLGATRGVYPDLEAARGVVNLIAVLYEIPVETLELDRQVEEMKKKIASLGKVETEAPGEEDQASRRRPEGRERYIT